MHLKLKEEQLKTIFDRLLYQNLSVTANQKSKIDTHIKKEKKFTNNTKVRHQITREENKRGREDKWPTKKIQNN